MKQLLASYSIASGGVITLTGVNRPREAILMIANATTGQVLYTAATGGASAYTQATNSTITLTTAPGLSDKLQIFYDDGVAAANAPSSVSVSGTVALGAGSAAVGTVGVTSLPSIPAGSNAIGQVTSNLPTGALTNYSGTITTGGTAQDIVSSGALTKFFVITNNSSTAMYLAVGATATTGNGIYIPAYGGYEFPFIPSGKLSLLCATTGAAFAAWGA